MVNDHIFQFTKDIQSYYDGITFNMFTGENLIEFQFKMLNVSQVHNITVSN